MRLFQSVSGVRLSPVGRKAAIVADRFLKVVLQSQTVRRIAVQFVVCL